MVWPRYLACVKVYLNVKPTSFLGFFGYKRANQIAMVEMGTEAGGWCTILDTSLTGNAHRLGGGVVVDSSGELLWPRYLSPQNFISTSDETTFCSNGAKMLGCRCRIRVQRWNC